MNNQYILTYSDPTRLLTERLIAQVECFSPLSDCSIQIISFNDIIKNTAKALNLLDSNFKPNKSLFISKGGDGKTLFQNNNIYNVSFYAKEVYKILTNKTYKDNERLFEFDNSISQSLLTSIGHSLCDLQDYMIYQRSGAFDISSSRDVLILSQGMLESITHKLFKKVILSHINHNSDIVLIPDTDSVNRLEELQDVDNKYHIDNFDWSKDEISSFLRDLPAHSKQMQAKKKNTACFNPA